MDQLSSLQDELVLDDPLHEVGVESTPPVDIAIEKEEVIQRLAKRYELPEAVLDKARSTDVLLADPEVFLQVVASYCKKRDVAPKVDAIQPDESFRAVAEALGTTPEVIQSQRVAAASSFEDAIKRFGGIYIPFENDPSRGSVYINNASSVPRDQIMTHELLYAMSASVDGMGYHDDQAGTGRDFNEGVTQLLTIGVNDPLLSFQDTAMALRDGSLETVYKDQVLDVATVLGATALGRNPITSKHLAADYVRPGNPTLKRIEFGMDILSRTPPNIQSNVQNVLIRHV